MRQRSNESLRDYQIRFREAIAEITDLEESLAVNYLAVGIDETHHAILLEELIEKNPRNLYTTFQIVEHRMTLQEAVGSIRTPRRSSQRYDRLVYSPRSPKYTTSQRYDRQEAKYSPCRYDKDKC